MTYVEILSIGNEVLNGDVVDTNANWLARQVTHRGGRVRRITTIPDEIETIAQAVRDALGRQADLILCSGGLGPTADDLSLAGIARALNLPLVENPRGLDMVRRRYDDLGARGYVQPGLTEARRKMARLPAGATPLWNSVGGAPGVRVDIGQATLIALPGVPEEMHAIFLESLDDVFQQRLPLAYAERSGSAHMQDDSILAPHHRQVSQRHPHVYVKTRVKVFGAADTIRITFAASAPTEDEARRRVQAALDDMAAELAAAGIRFTPEAA